METEGTMNTGGEHSRSGPSARSSSGHQVTTQWATIEEHFRKHDVTAIKKYDNDMDTLLVFAGLYSAVLTGFIIEFYKLLQQDNSDVTVALLSKISSQLDGSSASSIPDPSEASFNPSSVSTWVNLLWFLSLFMSLVAALFAMVAKQWLREYLTWTTLSADPSEVVVLRQLRAQAWETWQVPFILGAIPAFLELAVILFLCGMVVLLWTIDPVIAIVLTVFMAIFLAIVLALMVLPAIRHACPYKSPVGWACVWLKNRFMRIIPLGSADARWQLYLRAQLAAKTWARRDLYSITGIPRYAAHATTDEKAVYGAKVLVPMVRALSWVKQDSEDTFVLASVEACIKGMHEASDKLISPSTAPRRDPTQATLHRLKSAIFAACKLLDLENAKLRVALRETFVFTRPTNVGLSGYEGWKECVYRTKSTSLSELIRPTTEAAYNSSTEEEIKIAYRILLSAMEYAVQHMFFRRAALAHSSPTHLPSAFPTPLSGFSVREGGPGSTPNFPDTSLSPTFSIAPSLALNAHGRPVAAASPECHKAFVEMFCLTEAITRLRLPDTVSRKADDFIECVTKCYRHLYENMDLDRQYLGLRTLMFQTLCRFGHPERVIIGLLTNEMTSGRLLDRDRNPDGTSPSEDRYAIVATRLYRGGWEYLHRPEDRHLFVVAADMAFQTCDNMLNMSFLVQLFETACQAAQTCCENGWTNCGCYHDLPWVDTLLIKLRQRPIMHFPWPYLSRLLACLSENLAKNLLTGDRDTISNQLATLRAMCPTQGDSVAAGHPLAFDQDEESTIDSPEALEEILSRLREQTVIPDGTPPYRRSLSPTGSDTSAATIFDSTVPFGDEVTPPRLLNRLSIASVATVDYPAPVNSPDALAPFERLFPDSPLTHDALDSANSSHYTHTGAQSQGELRIGRHRSGSDSGLSYMPPSPISPASDQYVLPTSGTGLSSLPPTQSGRRRAHTFTHNPSRLSMGIKSSVPETISETMPLSVISGTTHPLPVRNSLPLRLPMLAIKKDVQPVSADISGPLEDNTHLELPHTYASTSKDDTSPDDADPSKNPTPTRLGDSSS